MLVSVVLPSFNQAKFIERTLLSIIHQDYKQIEIIIIDGGSNDGSVEIIKKYSKFIKYWISEPDLGQYDAANKGFDKVSGEIIFYLNADDVFYKNDVVSKVVNYFKIDKKNDAIFGSNIYIDEFDNCLFFRRSLPFYSFLLFRIWDYMHHPTVVFRAEVLKELRFNTELKFAGDYDFLLKLSKRFKIKSINELITASRWHINYKTNKTFSSQEFFISEQKQIKYKLLANRFGYKIQKLLYSVLRLISIPTLFKNYISCPFYIESKNLVFLRQVFGLRIKKTLPKITSQIK